jgi:hypothetical protein
MAYLQRDCLVESDEVLAALQGHALARHRVTAAAG